ncbi:hypothetical protein [Ensifer sp. BR816]|uniref:hypothetical protein n=1 Tax=Rhizobium sp. (strain BR816) TaxID=1057002 RepID=UPI0003646217
MQQDTDKSLTQTSAEPATPDQSEAARQGRLDRKMDPSESVTLFAIVLGAIGALAGLVAGLASLPGLGLGGAVLNCLIAILAGGSAGIVTGGTVGAAIGVLRGVRVPKEHGQ